MKIFLSLHCFYTWLPLDAGGWWGGRRAGIMQIARLFQIQHAAGWAHEATAGTLGTPGQLWISTGPISIFITFEISILLCTFVSADHSQFPILTCKNLSISALILTSFLSVSEEEPVLLLPMIQSVPLSTLSTDC